MDDLGLGTRTLIALGDVSFTFFKKLPEESSGQFLRDALDKYTQARKIMLAYFSREKLVDLNIILAEKYSMLASLRPDIKRVLEERTLAEYLNSISTRIPPINVNH